LAGYVGSTVLLISLGALSERRLGRWPTLGLLAGSSIVGLGITIVLAAAGAAVGAPGAEALAAEVSVVGPAAAAIGAGLAASNRLTALWRRRIRIVLVIGLAMLALYPGHLGDIVLVVAGQFGLIAGRFLPGGTAHPLTAPSGPETRVLLALVVAATGVGPLVAAIAQAPIGPLSLLQHVVVSPPPSADTVARICSSAVREAHCRAERAHLQLFGLGPAILSAVPVVLLLVVAEGLRRGRRLAWGLAVALNVILAMLGGLLAILISVATDERITLIGATTVSQSQLLTSLLAPALPLGVVVLLMLGRSQFPVRSPAGSNRRLMQIATVALAVVSVVYVLGGLAAHAQFDRPPGLARLLADLPRRLLPPDYLGGLTPDFLPQGGVAVLLFTWTGVVFWLVLAAALLVSVVHPYVDVARDDAARARRLLVEHGGESLSWLTTWRDNRYWFTSDADAAVAYRVIGSVALTTGDPIGRSASQLSAVQGFSGFCRQHGWTPCFYSISERIRIQSATLGWSAVQVAEETVVPLEDLAFTGKKWQDVRSALNKAAKARITAEWWTFLHMPLSIADQVRAISEEWVADKGLPEMGFTLGGLDELADNEVRCLLAIDRDRTVYGITSWLPVYRDGAVVGWTLDFMRRRSGEANSFRGVMEFLIATAALNCRDEGAEFISLSGAPLARLDRGIPTTGLQRLLDIAGVLLEPVYGFRSLLAFKAKFQPIYKPLTMAYPDGAALPSIALAISRAYLPNMTARQARALASKLRTGAKPSAATRKG